MQTIRQTGKKAKAHTPGTRGEILTDLCTKTDQTCDHRHDQLPGESKHKVSIEYVQ